jgi:hypothetical protein
MPIINVEKAQIKTTAVEIKTLTVSGKQVTLSVFRQIPEEELVDWETMSLKGVPWGNINYFWKDNGNEDFFHLLWQKGKELRRFILRKNLINIKWHYDYKSYIKNTTERLEYLSYVWKEPNYNQNWRETNIPYLKKLISELKEKIIETNNGSVKYRYESEEEILNKYLLSPPTHQNSGGDNKYYHNYEVDRFNKLNEKKLSGKLETTKQAIEEQILNFEKEMLKPIQHLESSENELINVKNELDYSEKDFTEKTEKLKQFLSSFNDLPQLFIAI